MVGRGEGEGRRGEGVRISGSIGRDLEAVECDVCGGRAGQKRSREELLGSLVAGDIFAADHLCLVVSIETDVIHARRLIVREERSFCRRTGEEITAGRQGKAAILSVEPLPVEVHEMILWLDRKNRLHTDISKAKLTDAEKNALLFVSDHYDSNPI